MKGLYEPYSFFRFRDSKLPRDRPGHSYSLKIGYDAGNLWVVSPHDSVVCPDIVRGLAYSLDQAHYPVILTGTTVRQCLWVPLSGIGGAEEMAWSVYWQMAEYYSYPGADYPALNSIVSLLSCCDCSFRESCELQARFLNGNHGKTAILHDGKTAIPYIDGQGR